MDNSLERLLKLAGVTQQKQQLLEAARDRYLAMFQRMIPHMDEAGKNQLMADIDWAMSYLKKDDRITWYLRWVRPEHVDRMFQMLNSTNGKYYQDTDKALAVYNKLNQQVSKFYNVSVEQAKNNSALVKTTRFHHSIEHFLSLRLPGIEAIVWAKQSPDTLLYEMANVEQAWQEQQKEEKRALPATDEDKEYSEPQILIQFPDGYAWWDLNQSSCSREGNSMGHCGNTAADDGTVYSLRKRVTKNGQNYDVPHLTFISHDGVLGEMKGRNNKKPTSKYHPYIIALLKSDYVTAIKGGGYAPEQNFSLNDLPRDIVDELIEEKPDLADLRYLYEKEGLTKRVVRLLKDEVYEKFHIRNIELQSNGEGQTDYAVVERVSDVEDFARNNNDRELQTACEAWTNWANIDPESFNANPDDEYTLEVLQALPDPYQELVLKDLNIKTDPSLRIRALRRAASQFTDSRYGKLMGRAYTSLVAGDNRSPRNADQLDLGFADIKPIQSELPDVSSKQSLLDYINFLVSYTDFEIEGVFIQWNESDPTDGVTYLYPVANLIEMLSINPEDDDGEDSFYFSIAQQRGFDTVREDNDYRDEMLNSKHSNLDDDDLQKYQFWRHKLNAVETDRYGRTSLSPKVMEIDSEPEPKDVAMKMVKLIDMNESEEAEKEAEDQMIAEMRRRAGIA